MSQKAEQSLATLNTTVSGLVGAYPPLVAPPDDATPKQRICYLLEGFTYLGDLMICDSLTDPDDRTDCIATAYATYLQELESCDSQAV